MNFKSFKAIFLLVSLFGGLFSLSVFANSAEQTIASPVKALNLVDKKNPYIMIKEVAGNTFKRFADQQQEIQSDPNILKQIVREELMPYFNYKYTAFKILGKKPKNTTKQEINDFLLVFSEYLVTSYAQVFTLYDKQVVEFDAVKDFADKKILAVDSRILMTDRKNINVSFKVIKSRKTNEWKAFDLITEGISFLDSKRAELSGVIRQKGLPYVTELLKEKSKQNIVFKD